MNISQLKSLTAVQSARALTGYITIEIITTTRYEIPSRGIRTLYKVFSFPMKLKVHHQHGPSAPFGVACLPF